MKKSDSRIVQTVYIRAGAPGTEIFLIDHKFQKIASGIGELQADVSPGLYKVRFRSGSSQHDKLIEVDADKAPETVFGGEIAFRSSVPYVSFDGDQEQLSPESQVSEWSGSRIEPLIEFQETHASFAGTSSSVVDKITGSDCSLFVCVRHQDRSISEPPCEGLSLHDPAGNKISEMSEGKSGCNDTISTINLKVSPGTYRIRVQTSSLGTYEMFVACVPGYQTQVFLLTNLFSSKDEEIWRPELRTASVMMSREGTGFNPSDPNNRLTDLARIGLEQRRRNISREEMSVILDGKFTNPMLGIYAAQQLALAKRPQYELIKVIQKNMIGLIGPQTDLMALDLLSQQSRGKFLDFPEPPMLRSSWDLIVRRSRQRQSIVPSGSLTEKLAQSIVVSHPWLINRVQERDAVFHQKLSVAQTRAAIAQMVETVRTNQGIDHLQSFLQSESTLTPLQVKTIGLVAGAGSKADKWTEPFDLEQTVSRIVRDLDAPPTSIGQATAELLNVIQMPSPKS